MFWFFHDRVAGYVLNVPGVYSLVWWLGGTRAARLVPRWLNPRVCYGG